MLMVKPGMAYLDVVRQVKDKVSGRGGGRNWSKGRGQGIGQERWGGEGAKSVSATKVV